MKKKFCISTLFILLILVGCKTNNTSSNSEVSSRIEDFDTFYDRFHNDSAFQLSRVKFPLNGGRFENGNEIEWTKENYTLLKTKIYDVDTIQFKTSYSKTDSTFYEKIWIDDSGFWVECEFRIIDQNWYLTTFNESNE
jgi:hypothetical protein